MPLIDKADLAAGIAGLLSARAAARPIGRELRTLREVLAARRSVRQFSDQPLSLADLEFVTSHAVTLLRAWWPADPYEDEGLTTLAAVSDVSGLPRGVYAVASGVPPRLLAVPAWLYALREEYAAAPALVAICGDLGRACSAGGAGYGGLLTAAGALGHAMWLSGLSIGLAASVYGRACHELTETARSLDPGMRHLFTIAIGHPPLAEPEAPEGAHA